MDFVQVQVALMRQILVRIYLYLLVSWFRGFFLVELQRAPFKSSDHIE
jgi:hypothetical protein